MGDVQKILYANGMDELEALYQAVVTVVAEIEDRQQLMGTSYQHPDIVALITALNHCEAVLLAFDDKVDDFYHIQGTPAELMGGNGGLPR